MAHIALFETGAGLPSYEPAQFPFGTGVSLQPRTRLKLVVVGGLMLRGGVMRVTIDCARLHVRCRTDLVTRSAHAWAFFIKADGDHAAGLI